MLLKTVMFDKMNHTWTNEREYNAVFLRTVEQYLNDIIRHRGYMYLNEICEHLGVAWNPEDTNPCVTNDGVDRITFVQFETFFKSDNSCVVDIICYDRELKAET